MKARQLVDSGSFGPDTLKAAYQAFDEAWQSLAAQCGNDPEAIEAARVKLANAILAVSKDENRDPSELKKAALALLTRDSGLRLHDLS